MYLEISGEMPITLERVSALPSALQLKGAFRCGREDCGLFVEVLAVGDVGVGLAKQAGCEACAEDAVDPQCGEHCAVVLVQCRSPCGDFDRR